MSAILFHCAGDSDDRIRNAVIAALPEHDIRVWPDTGERCDIRYAVVWQPPDDFFDDLDRLQAVFALAAGVDQLLDHPGLVASVPLVRLDDAGMGRKMAEYVLYGVLHAHRRFQELFSAERRAEWHDLVRPPPPLHFPIGILGAGTLATAVARRLVANGYPVSCWGTRSKSMPDGIAHRIGEDGLHSLLADCRVLVCLLPLTDATRGILNSHLFDALTDGVFLINVARGAHLVEQDLLPALNAGQLSGALLDVFNTEPLPARHPFWSDPRIIVTPHVSAPSGSRDSAAQVAASITAFEAGEQPAGLVDRTRGY